MSFILRPWQNIYIAPLLWEASESEHAENEQEHPDHSPEFSSRERHCNESFMEMAVIRQLATTWAPSPLLFMGPNPIPLFSG